VGDGFVRRNDADISQVVADLLCGSHAPSGVLRERLRQASREPPLFADPQPRMIFGVARTDNGAYIIERWYDSHAQAEAHVARYNDAIIVTASGIQDYVAP
jgi:hypothetical protein